MLLKTPPMGWNSWNTFGENINEELILGVAETMVSEGYLAAGYEYVIIDDCWLLRERVDGKLTPDPVLFPHGMKYLSDRLHGMGLKFGMYSCAGFMTCAGYPSSYGHEFEDAKQFAEWGVDYLKYDYCNFPNSGDTKNAYLTMAMALRSTGRDIVFAACNWGEKEPWGWMRSRGANTFRSTGDIFDEPQSYREIFRSQLDKIEGCTFDCYNDMDMLICGMNGEGNVGRGGCTPAQYLQHFAMWAFMGSPLIIGADVTRLDRETKALLQNKGLISINQDSDSRPPFRLTQQFRNDNCFTLARLLSGGRIAIGLFNANTEGGRHAFVVSLDDLGIHSGSGMTLKITDAITGEDAGVISDGRLFYLEAQQTQVYIGEVVPAK